MSNCDSPPNNPFVLPASPQTPWRACWAEHVTLFKRRDWLAFLAIPISFWVTAWAMDVSYVTPVLIVAWLFAVPVWLLAPEIGPKSKAVWIMISAILSIALYLNIIHRQREVMRQSVQKIVQDGNQNASITTNNYYSLPFFAGVHFKKPRIPTPQPPRMPSVFRVGPHAKVKGLKINGIHVFGCADGFDVQGQLKDSQISNFTVNCSPGRSDRGVVIDHMYVGRVGPINNQ